MGGTDDGMTDPSHVVDTFTAIDYDNTFAYLYGDRVSFAIVRNGTTVYGRSTQGPLVDASAAFTNWGYQTPDDVAHFIRTAYDAIQTLGDTARTVGRTALTVEEAAEVVTGVASVVGIIAALTGIGSVLASAMAAVDAAAIKTEQVATAIYHEAAQFAWTAYDMVTKLHDVEVLHSITPAVADMMSTVQRDLEALLDGFNQVLRAVTH